MTQTITPTPSAPVVPRRAAAPARPTLLDAIRCEVRKIAAQSRGRWTLLVCLIAPPLIVYLLHGQQRPPKDSLFGRYIHLSGWSMPFLILVFAAQWVLPLMTAIVAGDIFASEDVHGTWKTVLTRSTSRGQLFWAKTITASGFALLALIVIAASSIVSGVLIVGHQPLIGLSGQFIPSAMAAKLAIASWASLAAPMLGFTSLAILLSVVSRNSAVGIATPVVIGMIMQLAGALGGMVAVRPLLLTTPFESWHGLLVDHYYLAPLYEGFITSAVWCAACLSIAYVALRRRDVTGG